MAIQQRYGVVLLVLVALMLVGGATLSTAGAQDTGIQSSSNVTLTISATGTTSAPPDLAVVDIAVEASGNSADAVRGMVADNVSQLRDAIEEENVTDDQIRTTHFVIHTERDENGTITYHAVHGFEIRVAVDEAGSVVDAAVDSGATRVDSVRFTLTEETRRELRSGALEAAVTNAKFDAEVLANATGSEIIAIRSIETADVGIGPVVTEAASSDDTTFDPGPVTITAHVTVIYEAG